MQDLEDTRPRKIYTALITKGGLLAAAVIYRNGIKLHAIAARLGSAFHMFGILHDLLKTTVYVDNQAAVNLKAIQGIKPNAGHNFIDKVHKMAEEPNNKVQRVDIELIWIFGLKGVQGNSTLLISTPKELHHIPSSSSSGSTANKQGRYHTQDLRRSPTREKQRNALE
ncbi:hypothetical protein BU17DRAFT_92075 [Hysterangium stoloniferum]|nr:hypothetical protein BU17DRAFT_92075 [Hysterangium stoloniferum]